MLKLSGFLISGLLLTAPALAATPSEFVTNAIKGDNSEIMLGKYAAEHGASTGVKNFGRELTADHTKAKREMESVAPNVGVKPPTGATLEADAERMKLMVLSGKAFDREFANYMIEDHKSDISKFKAEANAHHGEVSKLAAKQLLGLEKHLEMAKSLSGN